MSTKLPWYVFPIYPSLALALGAQFAQIENMPLLSSYSRIWVTGLGILTAVAAGGSIYFSLTKPPQPDLQLILAAVTVTMALAAILAERGDAQFLKVLLWGTYVSLLLFVKSNYWVWEINEDYPVKPVAAMIQRVNPTVSKLYAFSSHHRPSLDFYCDRTVIAADKSQLQHYWQYNAQPYVLLKESDLEQLKINSVKNIDKVDGMILITKETNRLY